MVASARPPKTLRTIRTNLLRITGPLFYTPGRNNRDVGSIGPRDRRPEEHHRKRIYDAALLHTRRDPYRVVFERLPEHLPDPLVVSRQRKRARQERFELAFHLPPVDSRISKPRGRK